MTMIVSDSAGAWLPGPDRKLMEDALAPYVVRRLDPGDPAWRILTRREARKRVRNRVRHALLGAFARWRRSQNTVRAKYERLFAGDTLPDPVDPSAYASLWGGEGLMIRARGTKRAHHVLLAHTIERLRPRSVLEVGCGNGINLFVLAGLFPGVTFEGIELSEAGVDHAASIRGSGTLPDAVREFSFREASDPTAYRRVRVRQGNATALPYPDGSFDLVYTCQALEQMQAVRDSAVAEIARVSNGHVALIEPFAEFNRSLTQRAYIGSKDYLRLRSTDLTKFGIAPALVYGDIPQKIRLGVGLVLGRKQD